MDADVWWGLGCVDRAERTGRKVGRLLWEEGEGQLGRRMGGRGQARDVLQALALRSGSQFRGGCGTDLSVGRVGAGRRPSHQFL